jgi:ribosome-associated toxin RatA of RatAB toxin-antitoxin module
MRCKILLLLIGLLGSLGADISFAALCADQTQFVSEDALAAHGWEFSGETDGVRTYNRNAPGSSVREVFGQSVVDQPPERVFAVISDYDRYADFMPYVKRSETVRRENGVSWVFQHLEFRFSPISDRRYTIKISDRASRPNDGFYCIEWTLDSEETAKRDAPGITPAFNDGFWILQPLEDGKKTDVRYFVHTDPGGWLFPWMVNTANRQAIPAVIQAVQQRARSRDR